MEYTKTIQMMLLTIDRLRIMKEYTGHAFPRMDSIAKALVLQYLIRHFEGIKPTTQELLNFKKELSDAVRSADYLFKNDADRLEQSEAIIDSCFVHLMEKKELNSFRFDSEIFALYESFMDAEYIFAFQRRDKAEKMVKIYKAVKMLADVYNDASLIDFIDECRLHNEITVE